MGPYEAKCTLMCMLADIRLECDKHNYYPPGECQRIQAIEFAIGLIDRELIKAYGRMKQEIKE